MKVYDWGVFWEDGNKASIPLPFGPEYPDNCFGLDSPWIDRVLEIYPNFITAMEHLPFGFIIVNPPRDATPEEEAHLRSRINE